MYIFDTGVPVTHLRSTMCSITGPCSSQECHHNEPSPLSYICFYHHISSESSTCSLVVFFPSHTEVVIQGTVYSTFRICARTHYSNIHDTCFPPLPVYYSSYTPRHSHTHALRPVFCLLCISCSLTQSLTYPRHVTCDSIWLPTNLIYPGLIMPLA